MNARYRVAAEMGAAAEGVARPEALRIRMVLGGTLEHA
jgi:hypothetical protein